MAELLRTPATEKEYPLPVDYRDTIEAVLLKLRFTRFNRLAVADVLPEKASRRLKARIIRFTESVSLVQLREMALAEGLKLGTLRELATFHERYPQVETGFQIAAPGSPVIVPVLKKGDKRQVFVPYLHTGRVFRILDRFEVSSMKFPSEWRFLVVRDA